MLNSIIIHGRLTRDPEIRTTASGVNVCSFSVAVDRNYAKQGEEKQTDFFSVTAWRGLGDMVARYFTKGKEIIVWGAMQSRKYADKEGHERTAWEVLANGVDFCGSKGDGSAVNIAHTETAPAAQESAPVPSEGLANIDIAGEDDLPF